MDDTQRIIGQLLAEIAASREDVKALKGEIHDLRDDLSEMRQEFAQVKGGARFAIWVFGSIGVTAGSVGAWIMGLAGKGGVPG